MVIQGLSRIASPYGTGSPSSIKRQGLSANTTSPAKIADAVSLSNAAREALAASATPSPVVASAEPSVEARLAAIKAKGGMGRTREETDYLFANDTRLAELYAKSDSLTHRLTAEELDYVQKTVGFVNTMEALSPAEKALYDKAVAGGNSEAAKGIEQIAFLRTVLGHTAAGAGGMTYDPLDTEITVDNILKYFSHSIVDSTGQAQSHFQALIQFLKNNPEV